MSRRAQGVRRSDSRKGRGQAGSRRSRLGGASSWLLQARGTQGEHTTCGRRKAMAVTRTSEMKDGGRPLGSASPRQRTQDRSNEPGSGAGRVSPQDGFAWASRGAEVGSFLEAEAGLVGLLASQASPGSRARGCLRSSETPREPLTRANEKHSTSSFRSPGVSPAPAPGVLGLFARRGEGAACWEGAAAGRWPGEPSRGHRWASTPA